MTAFPAPTPRREPARWSGDHQTPGLIVMHSTVTSTIAGAALGVARFFATEQTKTSAHYVVDAGTVIQCVGDHTEAYHCGYNQGSIGIELCDMPVIDSPAHWFNGGKPSKVKTQHGRRIVTIKALEPAHRAMLKRASRLTAELCLAYGIPIRLMSDAQLVAWAMHGRKAQDGGIVTHAQMSRVFHASTHWDPGQWPSGVFMRRVHREARAIEARAAKRAA